MKSFKHLLLMIMLIVFPLSAIAQGSRGDQLYSEAITLMENGSKPSLNKAISTFRKAKLAYESSANKSKCDAKIKECQSLLKKTKTDNVANKDAAQRKQANSYYNFAVEEMNKGNFETALEYFKKAKDSYPAADTEDIRRCEEGILSSSTPLKFAQETIIIPCQGGDPSVVIESRLTGNWMMKQIEAPWLKTVMTADGLRLLVEENETNASRETTITVSHSGDKFTSQLKVIQHGSISYSVDGEDDDVFYLKFKNNDKSKLLITKVNTPDNSRWEILRDSTDQWIFPEPVPNGIGVTVSKHNGKEGRTGRIGVSYEKDGCVNITYIPVYQGTKLSSKVTAGMKKGWKSFTGIFTGK